MGHIHLGVLPRSRKWREVVDLLAEGAVDSAVVAASARAAEKDMLAASRTPGFVEAVRLLLVIPHAARRTDFGTALGENGLDVGPDPTLIDLITAISARLDAVERRRAERSDLSELAGRALVATLSQMIGDGLPGLFAANTEDVRLATQKLSWNKGIAALSRAFFGALVRGTLSSWLDRTLALEIGDDRRFGDVGARTAFDTILVQYSSEATRIIQEFASGWYGKTLHQKGGFETEDAAVYGAVCLKKIVEELRMRRDGDA